MNGFTSKCGRSLMTMTYRLQLLIETWVRQATLLPLALAVFVSFAAYSCASNQAVTTPTGEGLTRLRNNRPLGIDLTKDHPAPANKVIGLEIDFAMRNKQGFDQMMAGLDDPHSTYYHHWMTPQEIHQQFGESQAQFNEVLEWLQSEGLTITDKSYDTSSDYIRIKGTIAQIDKAFAVDIVAPEYDEYAARTDPGIPSRFDGVISRIAGLEVVGPLN